jgi:hypothetical protein
MITEMLRMLKIATTTNPTQSKLQNQPHHHSVFLTDFSDVLYTSVFPCGFFRNFYDSHPGSLF